MPGASDGGHSTGEGSRGREATPDDPRGRHPIPSARSPTDAASRLLRRHRRLLVFPLVSAVVTALAFPLALRTAQWAAVLTVFAVIRVLSGVDPVALLPLGVYPGFAAGIVVVSLPPLVCHMGLMHAVDQVRRGERPSVVAGFAAAARRLPQVTLLAVVVGLTLALGGLTERKAGRTRPGPVGRAFGTSFTALTYLAGPAAILGGASPTGMVRRSRALLEGRFGPAPVVRGGALKQYVMMGLVPLLVVQVALIVVMLLTGGAAPSWFEHPLVLLGVAVPLWLGLVYGWAVAAVVKTLTYVALRDGHGRLPLVNVPVDRVVETDDG